MFIQITCFTDNNCGLKGNIGDVGQFLFPKANFRITFSNKCYYDGFWNSVLLIEKSVFCLCELLIVCL